MDEQTEIPAVESVETEVVAAESASVEASPETSVEEPAV